MMYFYIKKLYLTGPKIMILVKFVRWMLLAKYDSQLSDRIMLLVLCSLVFSILKYLRMLHYVFSQVCCYMEPQVLEKPCLLVQRQKNVASNLSALRYILCAL